jgi:hypothetical protein
MVDQENLERYIGASLDFLQRKILSIFAVRKRLLEFFASLSHPKSRNGAGSSGAFRGTFFPIRTLSGG